MAVSIEQIRQATESVAPNLTQHQLTQLEQYAHLLVEWNQKMNLTAITDDEGICYKHFADSLAPLSMMQIDPSASLIDVGTGAGFPGIALKIARPDLKLTLLDSLNKRLTFLTEVCNAAHLSADMVHARAEDGGKNPLLREQFDYATARAVAHLRELSEYCLPFVKVGGTFFALKSGCVEAEVEESRNAIGMMGGKIHKILPYHVENAGERSLIIIKKISQTPTKFPRNAGKIAKSPLK